MSEAACQGGTAQRAAPAAVHFLRCPPGMAALPVPPPPLFFQALPDTPFPSASLQSAADPAPVPKVTPGPVNAASVGYETLCATVGSALGAAGDAAAVPPTAVGPAAQPTEEERAGEEDEAQEAQALLLAAMDVSEGVVAVPVFEGEEMLEAALREGGRGVE